MKAKSNHDESLGKDPIVKLLLKHSIPAAMGVLVMSIYSMVDTIFVGNYVGGIGIAAVTIVAPITFLVSSLGFGIGNGGGSVISIALGKDDESWANRIFGNQLTLTIVLSAIILGSGLLFFDEILFAFGADESTIGPSREYFEFSLYGLPFYMGQLMLINVLRSEDLPLGSMFSLVVPAILNIALDAWLIAGKGMGLEGAAIATAVSQALGCLIATGYVLFAHGKLVPKLRDFIPSWKAIKEISSLGSVPFLSQSAMSMVIILVIHILDTYGGDTAVSTYGLLIRIIMFAFFPVIGIVQGFMPIAGYNFGAGNRERLGEVIRLSFRAANVIALVIAVIMIVFRRPIVELFTDEAPLINMASTVVIYAFVGFPLIGIQFVSNSYFQAIGRAKPAIFLIILKQVFVILCLVILPLFWGLDGAWMGFPVSEILATIVSYIYFRKAVRETRGSVATAG